MDVSASSGAPADEDALVAEVVRRRGLRPADAKERVGTVCELVSARLTDEVRDKLVRDLPPTLARLFVLREHPLVRHHHPIPAPAPRRTLASGRPGSEHPLSEAQPTGPRGPRLD